MFRYAIYFVPFLLLLLPSCEAVFFTKHSQRTAALTNDIVKDSQSNNKDNSHLNQQITELSSYIKILTHNYNVLQHEYDTYKADTSSKIKNLNSSNTQMQTQITTYKEEIQRLQQQLEEEHLQYLLSESSKQMLLKNYAEALPIYREIYNSGNLNVRSEYCDCLYYSAKQNSSSNDKESLDYLALAIKICDHSKSKKEYKKRTTPKSAKHRIRYSSGSHSKSSKSYHTSSPQDTNIPKNCAIRCCDGTLSYSKHRRGTCSHHGGVCDWEYCR